MADQSYAETKSVGLYNGTDRTEDYGTLRICRRCGNLTDNDAYRYTENQP